MPCRTPMAERIPRQPPRTTPSPDFLVQRAHGSRYSADAPVCKTSGGALCVGGVSGVVVQLIRQARWGESIIRERGGSVRGRLLIRERGVITIEEPSVRHDRGLGCCLVVRPGPPVSPEDRLKGGGSRNNYQLHGHSYYDVESGARVINNASYYASRSTQRPHAQEPPHEARALGLPERQSGSASPWRRGGVRLGGAQESWPSNMSTRVVVGRMPNS